MAAGSVKETIVAASERVGMQSVQHVIEPLTIGKVGQSTEHHIGIGIGKFDDDVGDLEQAGEFLGRAGPEVAQVWFVPDFPITNLGAGTAAGHVAFDRLVDVARPGVVGVNAFAASRFIAAISEDRLPQTRGCRRPMPGIARSLRAIIWPVQRCAFGPCFPRTAVGLRQHMS